MGYRRPPLYRPPVSLVSEENRVGPIMNLNYRGNNITYSPLVGEIDVRKVSMEDPPSLSIKFSLNLDL